MASEEDKLDFIYRHSYANVQFADQKAMFLAPINVAALGAAFLLLSNQRELTPYVLFAAFLIAAGIALCGAVVWPRSPVALFRSLAKPKALRKGIVDPNMIARFGDAETFAREFAKGGQSRYHFEFIALIFKHCEIHLTKYQYLRLALLISSLGWFCLALAGAWSALRLWLEGAPS